MNHLRSEGALWVLDTGDGFWGGGVGAFVMAEGMVGMEQCAFSWGEEGGDAMGMGMGM